MGVIRSMAGMLVVEISSADIPAALAAITQQEIELFQVRMHDELTAELLLRREDWRRLAALCRQRGDGVKLRHRQGLYWRLKGLLRRPLLLGGVGLLIALTLILPTRVLFTRVEGNLSIPTARILEAAADSGICFGASRREVRSERMKNALLDAVPQLQWAGVNTYGCVAVISVRERGGEEPETKEGGISSIVADCDGVILSATATRGTCLCQPGQIVTKGQVLISGYTDLGLTIRGEEAQGEIFAQTRRQLRAITPMEVSSRGAVMDEAVKYTLVMGKKRINLWKGSGISGGSCGRMYEKYYITLPGGFQLPITLIKETSVEAQLESKSLEPEAVAERLESFGHSYLRAQMISGSIIDADQAFSEENGFLVLEGAYLCREMIGRVRQEKLGE